MNRERLWLHMMASIQTYVRRGRRFLRKWMIDPRFHTLLETVVCTLAGLLLSAASLSNTAMPLTLGLLCAGTGWQAVMIGLGGCIGYLLFWSDAGLQGLLWLAAGLAVTLPLGRRQVVKNAPLLLPAIAGLIVSASGVAFQIWMADTTSVPVYLLRVLLAAGSTQVFLLIRDRKGQLADWLGCGLAVLALAQIAPIPYLDLGCLAAGILCAKAAFPAAALAGLALDLAQITSVPMTAVLCMAYLVRLLPKIPRWACSAATASAGIAVMSLSGNWDFYILPGLFLGSILGTYFPLPSPAVLPRRGETGAAQVRLELAAGVFSQTEQLLLEAPDPPLDEESLITKAAERACGSCPCRKGCKDTEAVRRLPPDLLHRTLLHTDSLPITCRKSGRILQELQRSQEQLRILRSNRERLREFRRAVIQQYRFLSEFLQDLSDQLARRSDFRSPLYKPVISAASAGREEMDGDRCIWFPGMEGKYYIVLCDGMGTGLGAAQESRDAASMLHRLLSAGYPAEYALRSLNSLCALRGRAGAVTIDLAELHLDSGKALLYKWGAAPSYLISPGAAEKIGTVGPPPGLSVTDARETVERLSLRRGETLILLSDGVDGEVIHHRASEVAEAAPGEAAAAVLRMGRGELADDATAVVVRLTPDATAT